MAKVKAWLDAKLAKFISRTLTVFICASGFFWMERLGEDNWTYIALLYIGATKAKDYAYLKWGNGQ